MTHHPIIFTGDSVRAILDGRKTMTRRLLSPTWAVFGSAGREFWNHCDLEGAHYDPGGSIFGNGGSYLHVAGHTEPRCARCREMGWNETVHRLYPRYNPGDMLWIREIWAEAPENEGRASIRLHPAILYRANPIFDGMSPGDLWKWRNPMFMPRWASRVTLQVIATRIERLSAITEADAIAEGAPKQKEDHVPLYSHRMGFERTWNSLHRKPGTRWENNPWVMVVGFERVET